MRPRPVSRPPAAPLPGQAARRVSIRLRGLMLGAVLLLASCTAVPPASPAPRRKASRPLVKKVLPAVVNIAVTETRRRQRRGRASCRPNCATPRSGASSAAASATASEQMQGAGSGFIIDPSGIIVTNNHVVGHADKIVVSLADGTRAAGHACIGTRRADRHRGDQGEGGQARCPRSPGATRRKVEVGDWILAAGNPFGLGGSVTAGIVSARGPRHRRRPVRRLPAARRADQSGQFRRPDLQHGRPGGRRQHRHRLAHRRLGRHRLRHPERDRQPHRRRSCAPRAASSAAGWACRSRTPAPDAGR